MRAATSYPSDYLMRIRSIHLDDKLKYSSKIIKMYSNNIFDECLCTVLIIVMCMYQYHWPCWNFIYYHINIDTLFITSIMTLNNIAHIYGDLMRCFR